MWGEPSQRTLHPLFHSTWPMAGDSRIHVGRDYLSHSSVLAMHGACAAAETKIAFGRRPEGASRPYSWGRQARVDSQVGGYLQSPFSWGQALT